MYTTHLNKEEVFNGFVYSRYNLCKYMCYYVITMDRYLYIKSMPMYITH